MALPKRIPAILFLVNKSNMLIAILFDDSTRAYRNFKNKPKASSSSARKVQRLRVADPMPRLAILKPQA
jgi:hypothetical protein